MNFSGIRKDIQKVLLICYLDAGRHGIHLPLRRKCAKEINLYYQWILNKNQLSNGLPSKLRQFKKTLIVGNFLVCNPLRAWNPLCLNVCLFPPKFITEIFFFFYIANRPAGIWEDTNIFQNFSKLSRKNIIKQFTSRFSNLEKRGLIFSSSSFAVRVNLPHP